jgi:ubiquinone/menaquinone biosynthesis C-methylase UbiE
MLLDGTGVVGMAALKGLEQLCVVGIDLSLPMMQHAKDRGVRRLAVANVFDLPFAARFDHVTASFVLNHLPDCASAVVQMTRSFRLGGTIGLTSWAIGPSENEVGTAWREVAATSVSSEQVRDAPIAHFQVKKTCAVSMRCRRSFDRPASPRFVRSGSTSLRT